MKPSIIIVGGGVCGLMAARILSSTFSVTIVESRNKLGGRIRTIHSDNHTIEAGAEFVHGNVKLTMELLKEAGLHHVKAEGRMFRKIGNELKEQTEMVEGWEKLFSEMKCEAVDMTLNNLLDKHFSGAGYDEFKKEVRQYAMGFDVADPADASMKSLYNEWSNEETNYRIKEGYGALVNFLEKECRKNGCEIILGETMKQVNWQKDKVTAITASGQQYEADRILVTVPVNVIDNISFLPAIDEHISASKQIGFGSVIKVIIEFNAPIWKPGIAFIFGEELIPTWWTQYPLTANTLTGWAGGPMADKIANHSDEELRDIALLGVSNIFNLSVEALKKQVDAVHVFNWKAGAYSYATTQSRIARETLNAPVEDTLFFAGEGSYHGQYSGTVEAALSSAWQISQKISSTGK